MFVGDSLGRILVWDVSKQHGHLYAGNHFKITHTELHGDVINSIQVHPCAVNQIFVHSRDNCVRLIEFESSQGPKIKKRFFGTVTKRLTVRSDVSPDG